MLAILSIALTSCRTSQSVAVKPMQITAEFPSPYDDEGKPVVSLQTDGTVVMPLWYWLKITEYVIDVEANKELQELDNENIRNRNQKSKE